jgi:gliding motility-associated-like protein
MLEVRPYFTAAPLCDIPVGSSSCTLMGCPSSLPPPVIDAITVSPVLCNGGNTGSATVAVSGGTEPYSYRWSHSLAQIAPTAAFLEAGSYQVTVTDANGCQVTGSTEVTQPELITISMTPTPVNCRDGNDGQAQAQAGGGVGPYTYAWSNQEQGSQIDQLAAGLYRVTVTDANGCAAESSVQVTQPTTAVSVQVVQSFNGCFGAGDNEAAATPAGGTGPYTYTWSDGQTAATAVNLAPGSYTVTIVDTKNCEATAAITVADLEPITFELLASQPTCHDYANGSMSITLINGGAGQSPTDYTFSWSTGNSAISVANLPGGVTYSATVTDQQGCSGEASRSLDNPDPIVFTLDATPASCFGFSDGEAFVSSVSGPNDTYTYRWDNNTGAQTSAVATGLAAGEYIVFVTDNEGCQASGTAVVGQPPALAISFSVQDNGCFGEAKGQINASPSGGVGSFTLQWSNGAGGLQISNLQAGQYQSTLTDANGCSLVSTTEVMHPDPIVAEVKVTDVSCFGGRNGSFDVSAAGGTPPYQYSLNNRDYVGSSNLIGLRAGAYSVYVRDAKGCLFSVPATLAEPAEFTIDAGPDLAIIYGDSVQLQATLENAARPAEIIWLAPYEGTLSCTECPTPYARPEYTIDYEVYAIDANGCEATDLLRVIVEKVKLIAVPTGFTPNGDGENDLLRVHGRPGSQILSFQVFDRWGELVYQGGDFLVNDASSGWDGSYRDQPLNAGVYLWVLRVRYDDQQEEVLRGQTTLIR